MTSRRDQEFEAFVQARRGVLVRTATALTGDAHLAEDLVQTALVRVYLHWRRARTGRPDAYARRTLVNCLVDETRRPHRRERPAAHLPDGVTVEVESPDAELLEALARLPVGMRAAVVLRHVEGLDVAETASVLGCSTGNVKSQTARGLDRLRDLLGSPADSDHTLHDTSDQNQGAPR